MDMTYNYGDLLETTQTSPALSMLGVGILIFSFILSIIILISFAKILKSNGKSGWIVLIPIYNIIALMQVAGVSTLWIILSFIPPFTIVSQIILYANLAKKYGKSTGYVIGLIFLPIIFVPLLGFSELPNKEEEKNNNDASQSIQNLINGNNNNQQNENIEPIQTTPLIVENPLEQPVSEQIQNEAVIPNTFESAPVENISTPIEQPASAPIQNEAVIPNVSQNTPVETLELFSETIPNNNDTNKKYCKSCGKEMPSIVSICPNCGEEN